MKTIPGFTITYYSFTGTDVWLLYVLELKYEIDVKVIKSNSKQINTGDRRKKLLFNIQSENVNRPFYI